MTTTHDELRGLALAATPGPWEAEDDKVLRMLDAETADYHTQCWSISGVGQSVANAAYLAAVSPDVVLALLDEIVILRKGLIFYATPYTGNVARAAIAAADAVGVSK